jgi:hypothetical protein
MVLTLIVRLPGGFSYASVNLAPLPRLRLCRQLLAC